MGGDTEAFPIPSLCVLKQKPLGLLPALPSLHPAVSLSPVRFSLFVRPLAQQGAHTSFSHSLRCLACGGHKCLGG